MNPNLKRPHWGGQSNRRWATFKDNIGGGVTPGVSYSVPSGEVMVAAAPGEVYFVGELKNPCRAGGMHVKVAHPDASSKDAYFLYSSQYAHLHKVFVEQGDIVKRGQPIGNVSVHNNYAKLIFMEGSES